MNHNVRSATPDNGRLDVLDFIRGLAVLGIFAINVESFAYADSFSPYQSGFAAGLDSDFRFWTYLFFQGKFFSLFALLFGVGFYMFLEKAGRRHGQQALDLYAHRMFWLFVFGVAHAYLLWPGDILYHYAICGLLLLPMRSLRIGPLSGCVLALVVLIGWQSVSSTSRSLDGLHEYQRAVATPVAERSQAQSEAIARWQKRHSPRTPAAHTEDSPRVGGYLANVAANADAIDVASGQLYHRGILFRTLLLMLAGVLLYRTGIFHDYRTLKGYWPATVAALGAGLAANYSRHWHWTYEYFNPVTHYGVALAHHFSKEILGIAYLLVLNGVFQKYVRRRFPANPVTRLGRMALSNYLFQSVVAGLIFHGYGLGLHGSLSRSELWPFVLAVWLVQLLLSTLWLSRHEQGPMEALWRRLMMASALRRSRGGPPVVREPA